MRSELAYGGGVKSNVSDVSDLDIQTLLPDPQRGKIGTPAFCPCHFLNGTRHYTSVHSRESGTGSQLPPWHTDCWLTSPGRVMSIAS